ncbi:MAG: PHB depolymerase family esterase [Pseudomonadota bacterium]|nr:PHB depolymerase family esterase [Pseudomonadota bacterium]
MKFLDQLARLNPRKTDRSPLDPRVSKIIDDALASTGLGRGEAASGGIAAVIDDALTRAGLRGPVCAPDLVHAPIQPRAAAAPAARADAPESAGQAQGQFLARSFAGPAGTLAYKVYVPAGYAADASRRFPLLVMLHGCTQSPDDFAAGTRMNALADRHGLLVAYPAQSTNANGSKCWNWFRPQDQVRGMGEPALIAGVTAQVRADYRVDPARIYVAGLSAGAAMAVVLGRTYPEVYAAVGVHSGLPYRAAQDVASAFAAMKGGAVRAPGARPDGAGPVVPTIVFHGDRDHTVSAANGAAIVAQLTSAGGHAWAASGQDTGTAASGRTHTRTHYSDASGRTVVEDWRVHGGGHAWMGGSPAGTYTDPQGPDASAEMLRFFLQHAQAN